MKKPTLTFFIQLFLTHYLPNERGLSENTLLAYRDALKLLMRFLDSNLKLNIDNLCFDAINADTIRQFLSYLEKKRHCSTSTRNARLAALKTFFKFLGLHVPECLEISHHISLIPLKKVPHKTVDYLEADEIKAILESVDIHTRNGLRDKALLLFMYNTGARAQEIVDVNTDQVRFDSASQVVLTGKGRKQRICPLWPETVKAIEKYITVRKPIKQEENHLFLNARGKQITRFGLRYIVNSYTKKSIASRPSIKTKTISPHTFRHSTAMALLQAGNELNMVRMWLGHVSLNTTHMYIEIDMQMKRDILNKSKPPQLISKRVKWKQPAILQWLDDLCHGSTLCEVAI